VNFAFEHFADPTAALKEIDRVAKDRAYVWMSMPTQGASRISSTATCSPAEAPSIPTVERFVRLVYAHTSLKLVSLLDLPAGFTWLGDSEELRHLTWAIIDA